MRRLSVLLFAIALAIPALGQDVQGPFVPGRAYSAKDFLGNYFELPYVYQPSDALAPSGLYVGWTPGRIYPNGRTGTIVAGGTVAVTASKATCTLPTFSSCNIIYSNSTGTVANTTTFDTANTAGNTILAYVQTSGSAVTSVIYPYQISAMPIAYQIRVPSVLTVGKLEAGTSTWLFNVVPSARPTGTYSDYVYYLGLRDGGGSSSGALSGGAAQKTYGLYVDLNRPTTAAATGDSNDALLKLSSNNYAANDTNFITRGVNVGINNRNAGTLGTLESGLFGAQNKTGGTTGTLRGLTVHPENYGSVTDEMGGIDVVFHNEAAAATLQYGIRIRNSDLSNIAPVAAALLIPANAGNTTGFNYGVDLNGATINTADIRLSSAAAILTGTGVPAGGLCAAGNLGSIYINHGGGGGTSLYVCEVAGAWAAK